MEREIITKKQCIAIMVAFLLGSSLVLGAGGDAKRDAWIAVLAAMVISLPVFFVYARLVSLFPVRAFTKYCLLFLEVPLAR